MNGKTLYKVKEKASLSGVCAGVAEYLDLDISLVRILTVVVFLFTGVPLVLYIVLAVVLPDKSEVMNNYQNDDYSVDQDDYSL
jgi:phage shock protein PspC (stress-responsive transcriptional regulator)